MKRNALTSGSQLLESFPGTWHSPPGSEMPLPCLYPPVFLCFSIPKPGQRFPFVWVVARFNYNGLVLRTQIIFYLGFQIELQPAPLSYLILPFFPSSTPWKGRNSHGFQCGRRLGTCEFENLSAPPPHALLPHFLPFSPPPPFFSPVLSSFPLLLFQNVKSIYSIKGFLPNSHLIF